MMRNLTVEQYHMVQPKLNGSTLTHPERELPSDALQNFMEEYQEEGQTMQQKAHHHPCLVSGSTILFMQNALHMKGHCNNDQAHSTIKTMFAKL